MSALLSLVALLAALSWVDNSTNEAGFNVYRRLGAGQFERIASVGADGVTYVDPASAPGACYQVTAFNAIGESAPTNTACLDTVPNAPDGLTVRVQIDVRVEVKQ